MLNQLMGADSDECCELPLWHRTWNGFVPSRWWKRGKKMLAPAECLRQSDSVSELLLGDHRA